jgi:hypothetical protein
VSRTRRHGPQAHRATAAEVPALQRPTTASADLGRASQEFLLGVGLLPRVRLRRPRAHRHSAVYHPLGSQRVERPHSAISPLHELRRERLHSAPSELFGRRCRRRAVSGALQLLDRGARHCPASEARLGSPQKETPPSGGSGGVRAKVAGGFILRIDSWSRVCGGSRAAELQFCRIPKNPRAADL